MTRRVCACGCGADITDRRIDCVWHTDACRMAVRRGRRRRTPNTVRTGARKPTRYVVFRQHSGGLAMLDSILAHDRASAIRQVTNGQDEAFVAISERMLRSYDRTGKPA